MQTRVKKPSLKQQVAHLTEILNRQSTELDEVKTREVEVYRLLGGRFGGESPVDCAKRAASERSTLADKVLAKVAEFEKQRQEFLRKEAGYKSEIQLLNGQLNALEGVLKGAVQMAEAGKPKPPPADMVSPTGRILDDALERIMSRPINPIVGMDAFKRAY